MSRFERWSRRKRGLETEERPDEQAPASPPTSAQPVQEQTQDQSAQAQFAPVQSEQAKEEEPRGVSPASIEEHVQTDSSETPGSQPHPQPDDQPEDIDAQLPDPDMLAPESDFSAFLQAGVSPALKRRALRRMFTAENYNVRDGLDDYDHDFSKMRKLSSETTAQLRSWMRKLTEDTDEPTDETTTGGNPAVVSATPETQGMDNEANDSSDESSLSDSHGDETDQQSAKSTKNTYDPVRPTDRPV